MAAPDRMVVETGAQLAVAKSEPGLVRSSSASRPAIEITVGPGSAAVDHPGIDPTGRERQPDVQGLTGRGPGRQRTPTDRSEFRIEGGDTHGRITGFGMGPNISNTCN